MLPVACLPRHTNCSGFLEPSKLFHLLYMQNVVPEKLFTKERAVKQLLEIIDDTTTESNGKFYAWDKQEVPW